MKKDLFVSMKEQMQPEDAVVASLKYRIKKEKPVSAAGYAFRWVPATVSAVVAALLVFNMTMPAAAEQLPVVGKAFESLNNTGRDARKEGRTPAFLISDEREEEQFSLSVSLGKCDGLDLTFNVEVRDLEGAVTEKADVITLSDVAVEVSGVYLYPTDENPRLSRVDGELFSGEAVFNAFPAAGFLSSGEESGQLYCNSLGAYVEGATYEEVVSLYTYDFSASEDISFEVDMSGLEIESVGIEENGIIIEQILKSDGRTDVVYSVSPDVEYARSFSLYTTDGAPSVTKMAAASGDDGRYIYIATYDGGESLKLEETQMDVYVDSPFYIYSHATGEYLLFEDEYVSEFESEAEVSE